MIKSDFFIYVVIAFIAVAAIYCKYSKDDSWELKCIVSTVDGNKYCVREREHLQEAADLLAKMTNNCKRLVDYLGEKYPDNPCVVRLVAGFNPKKIMETLPTSEYTAYSENKGEKLAFCLSKKKHENTHMIDEHTLLFVAIHELSHIATESVGHKEEFWENFRFLLEKAKEAGIHDPKDYKETPTEYCGMKIRDNPFYDLK